MKYVYKTIIVAATAIIILFSVTSASQASTDTPPASTDTVTQTDTGTTKVDNPNPLTEYGPPGAIITAIFGGVVLIIKNINEGKKLDVSTYKERADTAERKSADDIFKMQVKLDSMERKLDALLKERETERTEHTQEVERVNDQLVAEIRYRYSLERLLAQHGIDIPEQKTA